MFALLWPAEYQGETIEVDIADDIDVMKSAAHNVSAEVPTNALENGARVTEHVVLNPAQLSLLFHQVNTNGGSARARTVWQNLKEHQQNRDLFTCITEHATYENMVIQNLSGLEAAPDKGAMQCALTLVQVNFVNLEYIEVPESQLPVEDEQTNKTATTEIEGGVQHSTELFLNDFITDDEKTTALKENLRAMRAAGVW